MYTRISKYQKYPVEDGHFRTRPRGEGLKIHICETLYEVNLIDVYV